MAQVSMKALDQKHQNKLLEKQFTGHLMKAKWKHILKNHSYHVVKALNLKKSQKSKELYYY